ncbi:MAG: BatA domain-containing protein [Bacteroidota bacterium]
MTFLNPAILWGLAAVAIPIILHFFNLQRPKKVLFSNISFVKAVQKTVVRRVKFKQWLLLLMRILAISALVLAFAGPVFTGEGKTLRRGNRSVAFILDNSQSMSAGNEKGAYLQQALSLTRETMESYSPQDEFLVMTTADLQLNASFLNKEDAKEQLKSITLEQNTRSHREILSFSDQLFSRSSYQLKELYFFSDFQISTVLSDSLSLEPLDSNLVVNYIPIATRGQQNAYIQDHVINSQIIEKGKPVAINMNLVNDGEKELKDINLRVLLNDQVMAINNQNMSESSSNDIEVSFTPQNSGWLSGYIEINDSPIDFDNLRYFSLYVPEKEEILVVEGQNSTPVKVLFQSVFDQFNPTFLSSRNIAQAQLSDYRSIILLGVDQFSSGLTDQLKTFLEEGGSILFFPGDDLELSSINSFYQVVKAGSFQETQSLDPGVEVKEIELDHPVFEGIFTSNRRNREVDAPKIFQYHPLELNNQSVHNRIFSLNDGTPLLVETKFEKGLLYTFSFFPDDRWTDLHVKSLFPPLIFRITQIMNQTQQVQSASLIGSSETKFIRTPIQDLIKLVDSEGLELIPEQYNQSGGLLLSFDKLSLKPGNYQLKQGDELIEEISFNISDDESHLAFATRGELQTQFQESGLSYIRLFAPSPSEIARTIQTEREGLPLWKYCLLLAVLFLVAEIAIIKFMKG